MRAEQAERAERLRSERSGKAVLWLALVVGIVAGWAGGHLYTGLLGDAVACVGTALSVTAGAQISKLPRIAVLITKTPVLCLMLPADLAMATVNGFSHHGLSSVLATSTDVMASGGGARTLLSRGPLVSALARGARGITGQAGRFRAERARP
ncbi:hypothetical protein KDL01_06595 [Actinospica durhamensis]|uniref:Uncharacterized protein n=1 Tax=Actinospica durhamensis TaxID=1508375 RepID=A0A941EM67_9ACTN|nr:hypothetical protein [Actinospica durhamensis]MBR7832923.1 hypothetical protein [Actinospica durhamensis]